MLLTEVTRNQASISEVSISQADRWAALQRVLNSAQFKRAVRLREFLLYVGRESIINDLREIREQEIGSFVFGRPASYDTSQDNIVRVNASELRKRLETYFTSEGINDEIIFTVPRGGYIPAFRYRQVAEPQPKVRPEVTWVPPSLQMEHEALPSDGPVPSVDELPRALVVRRAVSWIALALLTATCVFLMIQNYTLHRKLAVWKNGPISKLFWSHFFAQDRTTDIVLADSSFAFAQDVAHQSVELNDYLNQNYKLLDQSPALSPPQLADLHRLLSRNNGSIGDFKVAQKLLALDPLSTDLKLQFSREYSADQMREGNVVLIGSRKSNPWVELFESGMNFTSVYDPKTQESYIVNKHPAGKEQARYEGHLELPVKISYSVIAFVPNLNRAGYALIIEGTDSQATSAAGDWITSEDSLANLKRQLPDGPFPCFEVLMRSLRLNKTAFHSEIIAIRTYPAPVLPSKSE